MFNVRYELLSAAQPELGQAAIIPWDSETFGFNVALYEPAGPEFPLPDPNDLRGSLEQWTTARQTEQVCAKIAPDERAFHMRLQDAGFRYVDIAITAYYKNIETLALPPSSLEMTRATPEDFPIIQSIAAGVFSHGRYHADPRFRRALADKRYDNWIALACSPDNAQEVLAARHEGRICGFSVIEIDPKNAEGDLGLIALEKRYHGKGLGAPLVVSTLECFRARGARSVGSCISVSNTAIMNLHEKLGARCVDPTVVLHWQAPRAPHLRS